MSADGRTSERVLPGVRDWSLWTRPRSVVAYVLAVEAVAVLVLVSLSFTASMDRRHVAWAAGLVGAGVALSEASKRIERLRRMMVEGPHINMTSVWSFAAALLLPAPLIGATVLLLYAHLWARIWRNVHGFATHRVIFNCSTVLLSCFAAHGVVVLLGRPPGTDFDVVAGLVTSAALFAYAAASAVLVALVFHLTTGKRRAIDLFGTWSENALEMATLGLGAIVGTLVPHQPLAIMFLVPTLLVLHRAVLVKHLETAATTDGKTGLLNAQTWHQLAGREVERAAATSTPLGLLMIDIDHFKRVNDTYGHLVGDTALKAVAEALRAEMRDQDLLCRFGGEEFVALLPGVSCDDVLTVAQRLRRRVADIAVTTGDAAVGGLTISIGAAVYPDTAPDLDGLLLAADNALFAAKNGGRDQVRLTDTAPLGD